MPWVVGIDEAGYGPNLGPLVQAAVALHLPDGDIAGWETLRPAVRRCREKADGRLLIDDSKNVYSRGGLAALETAARAALILMDPTVGDLIRKTALPGVAAELTAETWYEPGEPAPVAAPADAVFAAFETLASGLPDRAGIGTPAASVVPAPRFNRVCDECDSKAVVLSRGLIELIPAALAGMRRDGEPVTFLCDKHGGRNYYAAIVQEAFPGGWVVSEKESAEESRYRIELLDRPVTIIFRPRADGDSVAVALASMLCKYLREVCMLQFNRFWAKHVPGIQPTAGYPGDAKRFFDQIKPAMAQLGLSDDQVWRKR
jgi:hypothetical protein